MARNLENVNAYLQGTLGIVDPNARAQLNAQGIDSFDSFLNLTDEDIKSICSNIRKPGGTIANPAFEANNPVAGVPATIPNPGVTLGHAREKLLRQFRYFRHHLELIQRRLVPAFATVARLSELWKYKEAVDEEKEDDIKLPKPMTNTDTVRRTIEDIDDYLLRKRGIEGVPLAYITRTNAAVVEEARDMPFGHPSHDQELIRRAPHEGNMFARDNLTVWSLLRHVMHGGPGWNWIATHSRASNGRAAYLSIKTHYLGESFQGKLKAAADKTIESAYYDGRARNFTLERYCERLVNAFADLEGAGEPVPADRQVRVFLKGLADPRLENAKSQVLATPTLHATFETAVNFVSQFADAKDSLTANRGRNVASFTGNRDGGRGRGAGRGRGRGRGGRFSGRGRGPNSAKDVTDRYYSPDEWQKLTPDQQKRVRDMRSERDRRRGVAAVSQSESPRNVRPKTDEAEAPTAADRPVGMGHHMSQRGS